jgi:sugar/nucleoside kinase (ribokinase family)
VNKTMPSIIGKHLSPIDYLVIGHITQDLTETGPRIGGTVTYSGLTAKQLGKRVGIVTSVAGSTITAPLEGIQIHSISSEHSSTFENIHTPNGRIQYIYSSAAILSLTDIPETWLNTPIIHIGPIFNEIDVSILNFLPDDHFYMTPQGMLRQADKNGRVHPKLWELPREITRKAAAIVISNEDVQNDEGLIEELADHSKVLVVTENQEGARVYWHGDLRHFSSPEVPFVEDTGAGDIFAAAFFCRYSDIHDPWEAAKFAIKLSAASVSRKYLESIPNKLEIDAAMIEILGKKLR